LEPQAEACYSKALSRAGCRNYSTMAFPQRSAPRRGKTRRGIFSAYLLFSVHLGHLLHHLQKIIAARIAEHVDDLHVLGADVGAVLDVRRENNDVAFLDVIELALDDFITLTLKHGHDLFLRMTMRGEVRI